LLFTTKKKSVLDNYKEMKQSVTKAWQVTRDGGGGGGLTE
jgi:hypothetical protein